MAGNRPAGHGASGTNVIKGQLQLNGKMGAIVFNDSGIFRRACIFFSKNSNLLYTAVDARSSKGFATVVLPQLGLSNYYKTYRIPFDLLSNKFDGNALIDRSLAYDKRNTNQHLVFNSIQNNFIQVDKCGFPQFPPIKHFLLNNWFKFKPRIVNILSARSHSKSNAYSLTKLSQWQPKNESESIPSMGFGFENIQNLNTRSSNTNIAQVQNDTIYLTEKPVNHNEKINSFKKMTSCVVKDMGRVLVQPNRKLGLLNPKGPNSLSQRCQRTLIESPLNSYANQIKIELNSVKPAAAGRTVITRSLQQQSIKQSIKTLAKANSESRLEIKEQFKLIQQQLKNVEQHNKEDMRQLQQWFAELKNRLSNDKQHVVSRPVKPPSLYGRLK